MNCRSCREEIESLDAGAPPRLAARAHLDSCAACREFAREREALKGLLGGLGRAPAPEDFDSRLCARLAACKEGRFTATPFWRRRFSPSAASIALAACFVLVAAATLLLYRAPSPGGTTRASADGTDFAATPSAVTEQGAGFAGAPAAVTPEPVRDLAANPPRAEQLKATRYSNQGGVSRAPAARGAPDAADSAQPQGSPDRPANGATPRPSNLETRDMALGVARTLTLGEPFAVPVDPSAGRVKVVLRDEQGASRVVSVRPVSFGAQSLVGRGREATVALRPASEGVW